MIRIYPSVFNGTLKAPAAAAHAQRLLFMASVPAYDTTVRNVPDCEGTDIALRCLEALGCTIKRKGPDCHIKPFPKNVPVKTAQFDFGRNTTVARIAIAMAAAFGIKADCGISGSDHMNSFSLTSRMALRGVKFSAFTLPFTMQGRLEPGEFVLDGAEGSQFISALLMALPLLHDDSTIKLSTPLVDDSFVELTVRSLERFKIKIEKTDYGYFVPGRQYYKTPRNITAENDWGIASLWIAAGAAGGEGKGKVIVTDLPASSPQLYRNVSKELPLIAQDFAELDFDASECPSLATFYAAMAAVKGAVVKISGVPQLRSKESDRLKVMHEICGKLGQESEITEDGLAINGSGAPNYAEDTVIECHNDPWIFMSMALAAAKLTKPIILDDEHCADSIYREFLKDYAALGGKYEIV